MTSILIPKSRHGWIPTIQKNKQKHIFIKIILAFLRIVLLCFHKSGFVLLNIWQICNFFMCQIIITSHEYDDKSLYVHLQISISFYIKVFQNVNKIENVEKSF